MNYQRPLLWRIFYSLLLSEDFLRIFSFDKTRREEKGHQGCQKKNISDAAHVRESVLVPSSHRQTTTTTKKQTAFQIFSKKGSVLIRSGLLFTVYTYTSVYPCLVLISSSSLEGTIDGKWQANNRCRQLYSCICTVGLVWKRNQIPKVSYRPSVYFVKLYIHFISFIHYRFLFYSPHFPLFLTIFGLAPPL